MKHLSLHRKPTTDDVLAEADWQLQCARSDKVREALNMWANVRQAIALERIATALESKDKV